jgi:hypothetical protein
MTVLLEFEDIQAAAIRPETLSGLNNGIAPFDMSYYPLQTLVLDYLRMIIVAELVT